MPHISFPLPPIVCLRAPSPLCRADLQEYPLFNFDTEDSNDISAQVHDVRRALPPMTTKTMDYDAPAALFEQGAYGSMGLRGGGR